ncbi:MAG: hypothetical protein Hyperionvirus5_96 [Hyperionvirus sp.]|uniref:Uncharacterized protein n=1 Tax=Hyperionvirus sp. TaxID=2487770 RepID=A0A3G5A7P0_9VIRU|nr:MAG: hypothetical protein Hyperionvirus5_96 [Hyperionvirus sp.]
MGSDDSECKCFYYLSRCDCKGFCLEESKCTGNKITGECTSGKHVCICLNNPGKCKSLKHGCTCYDPFLKTECKAIYHDCVCYNSSICLGRFHRCTCRKNAKECKVLEHECICFESKDIDYLRNKYNDCRCRYKYRYCDAELHNCIHDNLKGHECLAKNHGDYYGECSCSTGNCEVKKHSCRANCHGRFKYIFQARDGLSIRY